MRNKSNEKISKSLLKELPYYAYKGRLENYHGRFNNLIGSNLLSKRSLNKLTSLYDLDLFRLNAAPCSENINPIGNLIDNRIQCRNFSPHSFKELQNNFTSDRDSCFSMFHNNIVSINSNFENLQTHLLDELDYPFDIIGISETKIRHSNSDSTNPTLPGYKFEYVPTPLAFGGVGMFI